MKKLIAAFLALTMAAGLGVTALAAPAATSYDGGEKTTTEATTNNTTNFNITTAATQLSVTLPTALAIDVDLNSDATVGTGTITNNSTGIVEIKSIMLKNGDYTLAPYTDKATFMQYEVGSKKLGLSIAFGGGASELTGEAVTYTTGAATVSTTKTLANSAGLSMSLGELKIAAEGNGTYANTLRIKSDALVSPTGSETSDGDTAATMILVVGWYTNKTPSSGPVDDTL